MGVMSRQTSAVLPNLLGSLRTTSQSMPRVMLKGANLQDQDAEVENQEVVAHVAAPPRNSKAPVCCNASARTCSRSRIASTELRTGGSLPQTAPQLVACASYVPLAT